MYCSKCGAKNPKTAGFCSKCGNKLVESSVAAEAPVQAKGRYSTILKVIEVILWLGALVILFNFSVPGQKNVIVTVLINDGLILLAIGYIKKWHKLFGLAIGGMILMTLLNVFSTFSPVDIILFGSGAVGVYLAKIE